MAYSKALNRPVRRTLVFLLGIVSVILLIAG